MAGGHQLSVAVKGNFTKAREFFSEFMIAFSKACSHVDESGFRRIADFLFPVQGGIVAQHTVPQELKLAGLVQIDFVSRNAAAVQIIILYRHLVLSQSPGFIGAYDGNTSQTFHSLQISDDGVLPGHFLGTKGEHDGDDGAESLGNSGNSQSDRKEKGASRRFPSVYADAKEKPAKQ